MLKGLRWAFGGEGDCEEDGGGEGDPIIIVTFRLCFLEAHHRALGGS
jgi:hypothetical protein